MCAEVLRSDPENQYDGTVIKNRNYLGICPGRDLNGRNDWRVSDTGELSKRGSELGFSMLLWHFVRAWKLQFSWIHVNR